MMNWISRISNCSWVIGIAVLLLVPGCGSSDGSDKTKLLPQIPKQSHSSTTTAIDENRSKLLAVLWGGLLSHSDDKRTAAIEMLRDNPGIATYPFSGRLEWMSNNQLAIVIADKTLETTMQSFLPLLQQDIPALATRSPPFIDWDPEACSCTLLDLQICTSNMRRFVRSVDSVSMPPKATLLPKEIILHNLQYHISAVTSLIRGAILTSAEKAKLPGFDTEALNKLRQELNEDRKQDIELFRQSMQENKSWSEDLSRQVEALDPKAP